MKKIYLYVAGIVAALVPAVIGLAGNASFSQSVPLHSPHQAATSSSSVTPSPRTHPLPTASATTDDHGREAEAGDDRGHDGAGHDAGDDRGHDGAAHDAGDDGSGHHSGRSGHHTGGGSSSGDGSGHHSGGSGSDDGGSGGHGSDD